MPRAIVVPMGVKAGDYRDFLKSIFRLTNIRGALITMPHKVTTVGLLDECSTAVKVAGSCHQPQSCSIASSSRSLVRFRNAASCSGGSTVRRTGVFVGAVRSIHLARRGFGRALFLGRVTGSAERWPVEM
jgi:hypothetical protein